MKDRLDQDVAIEFSLRVHSLESVKRAAYAFSGRFSFDIRVEDDRIICLVAPLSGQENEPASFVKRFRNAVLDQDLRESIAAQTEGIRNVILAHAFSKTGLQDD